MFASTPYRADVHPSFSGGGTAIDRRHSAFWLPLAVIILVLLTVSANLQYAESGGEEVFGLLVGSTSSRQIGFIVFGAMGCVLLFGRSAREKTPVWPVLLFPVMLIGYVYATTLWSDDPATTLKRAIVPTLIVVAGFGIGRTWDLLQFCWAIFILSSVFLIISVCAELFYRAWMADPAAYRFSGIFHPGRQAFNCGMLALASFALYFIERRKVFLLVAAIAYAFIILTKARTGMAATLVASAVVVWPFLTRSSLVVAGLLGAFIAAALLTFMGATGNKFEVDRLATMGRDKERADPTKLTGRLPIWNQALGLFAERPILGYGYGAFWTKRRLVDFERSNAWPIAHAHSAYIESLVNLGLVGFSLGLGVVLVTLARSLRLSTIARNPAARLVAGLLTMALVSGFSEMSFVGTGYEFFAIVTGAGLFAFEPARRKSDFDSPRRRIQRDAQPVAVGRALPLSVAEARS